MNQDSFASSAILGELCYFRVTVREISKRTSLTFVYSTFFLRQEWLDAFAESFAKIGKKSHCQDDGDGDDDGLQRRRRQQLEDGTNGGGGAESPNSEASSSGERRLSDGDWALVASTYTREDTNDDGGSEIGERFFWGLYDGTAP